jgi:hypothetical protein
MHFQIVKMHKDEEVKKDVKDIFVIFDNYFTYFVPVFKYCYSDSRNLCTVMRAGGLAL